MNVSDTHFTSHDSGPTEAAGNDYEAPYDGVVEDRFYNQDEYRTSSSEQNNELRLKRKHRGDDDNGRSKGIDREINGNRVREDKRNKDKNTIKSLTRNIAATYCMADDPELS
jgi:AAA15 family ATPase/GTPase